ncbi:MAG: hypothetical protein E7170_02235 [Firmicutes bacterium]|nr:hypothetical protein [Bacillota bacterium]
MNHDLKIIKNKYGEKMMHLCREMFPTILEKEGALSKILLDKFEPSKLLYNDIIVNEVELEFKNYIYNVFDSSFRKEEIAVDKTPSELMSDAGYILYECKTESDIQSFKKYYKQGEELCTFQGDRLDRCHVYFAVKKNAEEIKREDFKNPKRQDLYGTSVISIQFTKDKSHTLSIKNRYNHTVGNPDATFGNNLDNIIPGLTDSFEKYYGMKQQFRSDAFEMPGYVMANDGKYYKYNYEINNIYYCPDNIIIDNFEVKRYEKEKYIVMDYFILDLKTGEIKSYDTDLNDDSFHEMMEDCGRPVIYKEGEFKKIAFYKEKQEPIVIILDKTNNIVGLENKNIIEIEQRFLYYNKELQKINIPNVEIIDTGFLSSNTKLKEIDLPKVKEIGNSFLSSNKILERIDIPNVETINASFLYSNTELKEIELPKVKKIDVSFLVHNEILEKINIKEVEEIAGGFLSNNKCLKEIELPKVKKIGNSFLGRNSKIENINLPLVEEIGDFFMWLNTAMKNIELPKIKMIGKSFFRNNNKIENIKLPNIEFIDRFFLSKNDVLKEIEIRGKEMKGSDFFDSLKNIKEFDISKTENNIEQLSNAPKI